MLKYFSLVMALLIYAAAANADADKELKGKDTFVLGWLEHVVVPDADLKLDAKLDTGAKTSSIHAEILDAPKRKDFDEDERAEILFRLLNEKGETREVRGEIARWAAIKKKSGGVLYRPVVEMTFCLGGELVSGEVTLADRGHFNYETLIGRNMLEKAGILVDASDIYTKRPRCD